MTRYRYGAFQGGPDPLAPPFDVGGAVDDLADGFWRASVGDALRDLMQSGMPGHSRPAANCAGGSAASP